MGVRKIYFDKGAVIYYNEPSVNAKPGPSFSYDTRHPFLLIKTTDLATDIFYKKILGARFYVYLLSASSYNFSYDWNLRLLNEAFDENTVTYYTKPTASYEFEYSVLHTRIPSYDGGSSSLLSLKSMLYYGAEISVDIYLAISTPYGSYAPYWEVSYEDEDVSLVVSPTYPAGAATISRSLPATFRWSATPTSTDTIKQVAAASSKFRWRYAGESNYIEIAADSLTTHTVPANTFRDGAIEWQVEVTANTGAIMTTEWTTTEVAEPLSSAKIIAPKNTVLDGSAAQTFSWEHKISNGTNASAFELQTSVNGADWSTICHIASDQNSTTFDPGTFVAGDLWWRVRTYNLSNIAGNWSDSAHCIVIAAPDVPAITSDNQTPKFSVRWQQTGQQAYELMLDGKLISKRFTEESVYIYDEYLASGTYEVKVRIQNQYQIWSGWGSMELQVSNVPGPPILMTASGDNDMRLSWNASDEYSAFWIYRDGKKIAETIDTQYLDPFAVGPVVYAVRGILGNTGYYTMSNEAKVSVEPRNMMIADVKNPDWLPLPYSSVSLRTSSSTASKSVTFTHYIGTELPSAEVGEALSKGYTLECAWKTTDYEAIARFESLLGKVICLKTPSLRKIVGVITQIGTKESRFITSFTAPITEVNWEEGSA